MKDSASHAPSGIRLAWNKFIFPTHNGIPASYWTSPPNAIPDLVPAIGRLLEEASNVKTAYLCHPCVQYMGKIKRRNDHNLCGYHNTQMQISYMRDVNSIGFQNFKNGIPSILDIQNLIEGAWDKGIDAENRGQTGGIRLSRRPIGTAELRTLCRSLGMEYKIHTFHGIEDGRTAYDRLLDYVEEYFIATSSQAVGGSSKVKATDFAPIYLQRPSHSITIIGFEVHLDGSRNLLVFDPAVVPSKTMCKGSSTEKETALLDKHRCGQRKLKRYKDFETLYLRGGAH